MAKPKVIVICTPGADAPPVERLSEEADFVLVRTEGELRDALPGTEILFLNHYRSELLRTVGPGDLKWVHTSSIGVDALMSEAIIESGLVVSTSRNICERPIAEWVLGVLLMFVKDLRQTIAFQEAGRWVHRESEPLLARRVVLLGPGPVGREIALLLRAAGMYVDVVGRSARTDEQLGNVHAIDDLDGLLPDADDLVVALPLTDATRGLIDGRRLSLLQPSARLVNVGRGPVVDEDAVLDALRSGSLAGAALDVFDQEPLPADHPFWGMDRVLVSPHMSGDLVGWRDLVVDRFATNLRHWVSGEPLESVVDLRDSAVNLPGAG